MSAKTPLFSAVIVRSDIPEPPVTSATAISTELPAETDVTASAESAISNSSKADTDDTETKAFCSFPK